MEKNNIKKISELLNSNINTNYKITKENKFKLSTGPSKSKPICKRQLYLELRNYLPLQKFTYQQINTFEIGSQLENLITKRLTEYGFKLSHILEQQQEFIFFPGLKGFADGIVESIENTFLVNYFPKNTRMLLEMKTAKDKNFKILQEKKLRSAKIQHFAQMQSYLFAMSKMEEYKDIKYGLYICLNKDNSNMYFEIIERDLEYGENNINELKEIIYSSIIPHKTTTFCNWCDYKEICDNIDDNLISNNKFRICNKCKYCNRDKENGNIICEKNLLNFNIDTEEITTCTEFNYPDKDKWSSMTRSDKESLILAKFFQNL